MAKINTNHVFRRETPRVLVSPLDWGLGHATRCIPVVYELQSQGAEVWLAGNGPQETLLRHEFPKIPWLPLEGYRIRYGRSAAALLGNIFVQIPRILKTIKKEHEWLDQMITLHEFDAVISDNRFGLYSSRIPSIFITHQLAIKSPFGKWTESILQKNNYRFINRFSRVWIPDLQEEPGLAGALSHPSKLPAIPIDYTGPLSRLKKRDAEEKKRHLFISLSGPEPQRSLLENKIIQEVSHYRGTATIVRGLPGAISIIPSTNDILFYNHLPAEDYAGEMEKAEYVIARSGYSTVMDLLALGKKSILIPTPGQTEQEYLGRYLQENQWAYSIAQKDFRLDTALEKASGFYYREYNNEGNNWLEGRVRDLLKLL